MSNYRDDVNDTAVASDSTWMRMRTIAESTARVRDVLLFGLIALTVEAATASDSFTDKTTIFLTETAHVSDQYLHRAYKSNLLVEPGRASDAVAHSVRVLLTESAHAADELQAGVHTVLVERAAGSDEVAGQRYSKQTVQEQGKIPQLNEYQCGTYSMHSLEEAHPIARHVLERGIGVNHNDELALPEEKLKSL